MNFIHVYIGFLLFLPAQLHTLKLGDWMGVKSILCISKESAVKIAEADGQGGPELAVEVYNKDKDCAIVAIVLKPTHVVFTAKTKRGETHVVEADVELVDGSMKQVFFITDLPIVGVHDA